MCHVVNCYKKMQILIDDYQVVVQAQLILNSCLFICSSNKKSEIMCETIYMECNLLHLRINL